MEVLLPHIWYVNLDTVSLKLETNCPSKWKCEKRNRQNLYFILVTGFKLCNALTIFGFLFFLTLVSRRDGLILGEMIVKSMREPSKACAVHRSAFDRLIARSSLGCVCTGCRSLVLHRAWLSYLTRHARLLHAHVRTHDQAVVVFVFRTLFVSKFAAHTPSSNRIKCIDIKLASTNTTNFSRKVCRWNKKTVESVYRCRHSAWQLSSKMSSWNETVKHAVKLKQDNNINGRAEVAIK